MRVLFVNENIGGHATVHHHLANALFERDDVQAEFLTVPAPHGLRRLAGAAVPGLGRLDLDLQPLRAQLALGAWVRARLGSRAAHVDAVHIYTHNAGLLATHVLAKVPTVVSLDTTNANNAYRLPYRMPTRFTPATVALTKPFERRVYDAAVTVVANSEWAARSLRDDYGVAATKIRVFPFGIAAPAFASPEAPGTTGADLPTLVFVGNQLRRKGGEMLRTLHQRELADRCRLVLVTPESVAAGRNLTVIGDIRPGDGRLWDVLRSAAAFVFPSTIDQAPNAVLEAMAAGLPVVAVDTGAVGEMVADGQSGLLVPIGDEAALRRAIDRVLGDPAERARMGAASRARFDERYRADVSTARLIDVIADAVAQRRKSP